MYGIFISIPSPEITHICARSGFEFAVLDGEHGRIPPHRLLPLVDAARAANRGFRVYYRLAELSAAAVTQSLDAGVDGIIAPQVCSSGQVKDLVRWSKFAPLGLRGVHPGVRAAEYGFRPADDYLTSANSETMLAIQIETLEAYNDVEAIVSTEGVDMVFPGPFDLSQALGVTGQVRHPDVIAIMSRVAEVASARGVALGTFAASSEDQAAYKDMGYTFLAVDGDIFMLGKAFRDSAARFYEGGEK